MKCPIDGTDLLITERQSIEIDYCPKCRGVWLDRGELDKLIDRAAVPELGVAPAAGADPARREAPPAAARERDYREPPREYRDPPREYRGDPPRDYREPRRDYDDDDDYRGRNPRRRRSFLDDIFDFD